MDKVSSDRQNAVVLCVILYQRRMSQYIILLSLDKIDMEKNLYEECHMNICFDFTKKQIISPADIVRGWFKLSVYLNLSVLALTLLCLHKTL